jgi:hypothetical protein
MEADLGPASFIMVLIGCTQGQDCNPVMTLPIAYQSEASCLSDRSGMVSAIAGRGYDRVFAECRKQPIAKPTSGPRDIARQKPVA